MVVVGPGNVGVTLAIACRDIGDHIVGALVSNSPSSARRERFGRLTGGAILSWEDDRDHMLDADLIWITVPDDEIASVAGALASQKLIREGQIIAHTSGALASEAIQMVRRVGAFAASFHPLQTFVRPELGLQAFSGVTIAIEGDEPATEYLSNLARRLGAVPYHLAASAKVRYHAAAVLASNALIALVGTAAKLADLPSGLTGLLPLVRGAVENLERVGAPDALTGPIERGDIGTVKKHLAALSDEPAIRDMYVAMGKATVEMAKAKGSIDDRIAERLLDVLRT